MNNKPNFYVENDELRAEIVKSKERRKAYPEGEWYKRCDFLTPRLVELLMKIAYNYSLKWNFRGYTYIEDMRMEAVEVMLKNCLKFDESRRDSNGKLTSPLSYYTLMAHRAFILRIQKENKHKDLAAKIEDEIRAAFPQMFPNDAIDARENYARKSAEEAKGGAEYAKYKKKKHGEGKRK